MYFFPTGTLRFKMSSPTGTRGKTDLRTLEGGCLLSADVRRKKKDPVARLAGGQGRSAAVQLFDYDPNVLVAEVSLLLDKVPTAPPAAFQ